MLFDRQLGRPEHHDAAASPERIVIANRRIAQRGRRTAAQVQRTSAAVVLVAAKAVGRLGSSRVAVERGIRDGGRGVAFKVDAAAVAGSAVARNRGLAVRAVAGNRNVPIACNVHGAAVADYRRVLKRCTAQHVQRTTLLYVDEAPVARDDAGRGKLVAAVQDQVRYGKLSVAAHCEQGLIVHAAVNRADRRAPALVGMRFIVGRSRRNRKGPVRIVDGERDVFRKVPAMGQHLDVRRLALFAI